MQYELNCPNTSIKCQIYFLLQLPPKNKNNKRTTSLLNSTIIMICPCEIKFQFKQLLYTMSQKFINLVEKTQKKLPNYNHENNKRFTRKKSQSSDRSIDSKRSRRSDFQPHYIKNSPPQYQSKNQKVYLDSTNIFQHLANQTLLFKQGPSSRGRYSRTRTDRIKAQSKQQTQLKVLQLKSQLQVRLKQMQVLANECKYLKQTIAEDNIKRKIFQNQNKKLIEQLNQNKKVIQKWEIQNKKLMKEKQYLQKQIQFLERINYDQKTRSSQSYRQKYLQKEVVKLKQMIKQGRHSNQRNLEEQIAILNDEKYIIQSHYRALKLAHQTLQKQFQKQKYQQKQLILQSQEYIKLRQKYKRFLEQYKRLRIQYCQLQAQLNLSKSQIFAKDQYQQLSINLSQSSSQESQPKAKNFSLQLKTNQFKQNLKQPKIFPSQIKKLDSVNLIIKQNNVEKKNQGPKLAINSIKNSFNAYQKTSLNSSQRRKFQI